MNSQQRIFGLDVLRVIAIMFVFWDHSNSQLKNFINTPFPFHFPNGSDLALVLSGYLIGKSLIQMYLEKDVVPFFYIKQFLLRRWFRTLPNYYWVLLINSFLIVFGLMNGTLNKYFITYLVFFQNFYKPYDFLFWESWSLALQEWFYVLFPTLLFVIFKIKNSLINKHFKIIIVILFFLLFSPIYRFSINQDLDWDLFFRKIVLARFDSIGYGLLIAYLHIIFPKTWNYVRYPLFLLGLVSMILLYNTLNTNYKLYANVFYFPLLSISIACVFPFLVSLKEEKIPFKPFAFFGNISYSVYLLHVPVNQLLSKFFSLNSTFDSIFFIFIYSTLTICIAIFNYKYLELYFIKFQKRISLKIDEKYKVN